MQEYDFLLMYEHKVREWTKEGTRQRFCMKMIMN